MVSDSDLCCTADLLLFTPYISVLAEKVLGALSSRHATSVSSYSNIILPRFVIRKLFLTPFFKIFHQLASHASVR